MSINDSNHISAIFVVADQAQHAVHAYYVAFEASREHDGMIPIFRQNLSSPPIGVHNTSFPDRRSANYIATQVSGEDVNEQTLRRYNISSLMEKESEGAPNARFECTRVGTYIYESTEHDTDPALSTFGQKMLVMLRDSTIELVDLRPRSQDFCAVRRLSLPERIGPEWYGHESTWVHVLGRQFAMDFELGILLLRGSDGKLAVIRY